MKLGFQLFILFALVIEFEGENRGVIYASNVRESQTPNYKGNINQAYTIYNTHKIDINGSVSQVCNAENGGKCNLAIYTNSPAYSVCVVEESGSCVIKNYITLNQQTLLTSTRVNEVLPDSKVIPREIERISDFLNDQPQCFWTELFTMPNVRKSVEKTCVKNELYTGEVCCKKEVGSKNGKNKKTSDSIHLCFNGIFCLENKEKIKDLISNNEAILACLQNNTNDLSPWGLSGTRGTNGSNQTIELYDTKKK